MRPPDGIEAPAAPAPGQTSKRAQPLARRDGGQRRSSLIVVQRLEGKVCGQFHDFPSARRGSPVSPEATAARCRIYGPFWPLEQRPT
jgi:hypothetical protein